MNLLYTLLMIGFGFLLGRVYQRYTVEQREARVYRLRAKVRSVVQWRAAS